MKEVDKQKLLEQVKEIINNLEEDDLIEVRCSFEEPDFMDMPLELRWGSEIQWKPYWKEIAIRIKNIK